MDELPLLTVTSAVNSICQACKAECCKRYWITLLPSDLARLAEFKKTFIPEFISQYTLLYLRLFPVQFHESSLCISVSQLPKRIVELVHAQNCHNEFFTLAPFLSLKREHNACTFLENEFECSVYFARPTPCQIFPFTDAVQKTELKLNYPFCGLIDSAQPNLKLNENYSQEISSYFDSIKENGFSQLFPILPSFGNAFLSGLHLGEISQKEFLECLAPFV